jgi:D-sedoheptulose 7-phosphate isomerase
MPDEFNRYRIADIISESVEVKKHFARTCSATIERSGVLLAEAALHNKPILLCGNGGSAADAQHIAAELVVRLRSGVERRAIKALALTTDSSVLTAGSNDYGYNEVFARQVQAFAEPGGVLIAITTSGTSANVVRAAEEARNNDMRVIGLTGGLGGNLAHITTECIVVPSTVTARIQECHILTGHIWCEMIEELVFPELFTVG